MPLFDALFSSIHPYVAISPKRLTPHSAEFATAAASDIGMKAQIDATKVLAMTAADVINNSENLTHIKAEFRNTNYKT